MLRVECINDSNSSALEFGKVYYAFPFPRGDAAYISRFSNKGANFGCFQLTRFKETDKPTSTFYSDNYTPIARQKSEFKEGSFYLAKRKQVADKYNPYLYVYAVSEEIVAVYDNESFEYCLGSTKANTFEKAIEIKPPEKIGKICSFPMAITYGFLMDRGVSIENVREKLAVINEKPLCKLISNSSIKFEQLSLF